MKKDTFRFSVLVCSILLFHNMNIAQTIPANDVYPTITMERTEIRALHSDIVGQDYELLISLPFSYTSSTTKYPVIFLLDPYRAFSIMKGFTDAMAAPYQMLPDVIIVGIGYGGEEVNARLNYAVGRARDYSPVQDSATEEWYEQAIEKAGISNIDVSSGGAPLFLKFIKDELYPFIEANYRIDTNNRIFSGYSFGGLFGLYALFHDPALFNKYFLGSPSIRFKDGISLKYESNYANNNKDLKAEVFMSVGGKEEAYKKNMNEMVQQLNSRNYDNLILETVIFEEEGHFSCYPAAMSRGLFELFNNENEQ